MAKHTLGPWELEQPDRWPYDLIIKSPVGEILQMQRWAHSTGQNTLADCRDAVGFRFEEAAGVRDKLAEQEANARLIAAAPDLLFYAKAILQDGNIEQLVVGAQGARVPFSYAKLDAIITGLQEAIDKAEGE